MHIVKTASIALLIVLIAIAAVISIAALRWRTATNEIVHRLEAPVGRRAPAIAVPRDLDGLPGPVARYLRLAVDADRLPVAVTRARWRGEFLIRAEPQAWRPFEATQVFRSNPAGFVWDARIRMAPGVVVFVRDAFVDGAGAMRGAVLGFIPLVNMHGTPEMAAGALHRFLGEAVWFPTALMPGGGVAWTPVDESSARASLQVGSTPVSLDFRFGGDGLVESLYTSSRFRDVDGVAVPTPWEGRVAGYEVHDGLRVPSMGEAAWLLPEGRMPYWRGELLDVTYVREAD